MEIQAENKVDLENNLRNEKTKKCMPLGNHTGMVRAAWGFVKQVTCTDRHATTVCNLLTAVCKIASCEHARGQNNAGRAQFHDNL